MNSISCDVFIIPNSLSRRNDFIMKSMQERLDTICKDNDIELTPDTINPDNLFVQVWLCNDECDNICRGGYEVNGKFMRLDVENIPVSLFEGKKEGDTVVVKMRTAKWASGEPVNGGDLVEVTMKLNQLGYRYCRFGTFECCLDDLKADYRRY